MQKVFGTALCNSELVFVSFIAFHFIAKVETAVEKRIVDKHTLLRIAAGRVTCVIAERVLQYSRSRVAFSLNVSIKQLYSSHIFHAMARLDVPTFNDPVVQRRLESTWSTSGKSSIAWETIEVTLNVVTTALQLFSQVSVLINILYNQHDGMLLALLTFLQSVFQWVSLRSSPVNSGLGSSSFLFHNWSSMLYH